MLKQHISYSLSLPFLTVLSICHIWTEIRWTDIFHDKLPLFFSPTIRGLSKKKSDLMNKFMSIQVKMWERGDMGEWMSEGASELMRAGWVAALKRVLSLNEPPHEYWDKQKFLAQRHHTNWIHLSPFAVGRRGIHPFDPLLFIHPPLHSHPPAIPTQPRLIMPEILMTTTTIAALETKQCVGHRDSLSTCETPGWRKTNSFECFCSGSSWIKMCAIFALRAASDVGFFLFLFLRYLWKHYILKKVTCAWSQIPRKQDSRVQQQSDGRALFREKKSVSNSQHC